MNTTFIIRCSAIAAAATLIAFTSTAAAGHFPPPLRAGEQPLSAGVHVFDLVSREQGRPGYKQFPRIVFTLPSGWFNYNGWGVNNGDALSMSFWDVDKVYPTGCKWQGKPKIDPGRTVDGLAQVLATRPLRHASKPTAVVLAGFHGKYLRWSVPSKIDLSRCGQGYFESWKGRGWATDRWQQGAGQVDRLWILDVHGKRLVVDANYLPQATRTQRAELDRIVHSIRFLPDSPRKTASATPGREAGDRNGAWIAFSTAPARGVLGPGSDVFVTRVGGPPVLVAGSRSGKILNVCPDFSPNGRMLAFARLVGGRSSIVVVHIGIPRGGDGSIVSPRSVLKVPSGRVRCPRWSSNSSRLAYLDRGRVVVRGLDGSTRHRTAGDPTIHDFDTHTRELVAPTGDLIAGFGANSTIVVSRPDGFDQRIINDAPPSYAIAGWSPDGSELLVMRDVGGGFNMRAVSVDKPFTSTTVVAYAPVNGARSWPGYGDVSWQTLPRRTVSPRKTASAAGGQAKSAWQRNTWNENQPGIVHADFLVPPHDNRFNLAAILKLSTPAARLRLTCRLRLGGIWRPASWNYYEADGHIHAVSFPLPSPRRRSVPATATCHTSARIDTVWKTLGDPAEIDSLGRYSWVKLRRR